MGDGIRDRTYLQAASKTGEKVSDQNRIHAT